jgi:PIN domain nuclease of toxin-antitoxin system
VERIERVRLLLDTHVVLWWGQGGARLRAEARRRIADADEVYVSAASAWEVAIKVSLGKLTLPGPLFELVTSSGFSALPVGFAHVEAVENLPPIHADPFDRMLVAQAIVEGLHLMSRDRLLARYPAPFIGA